MLLLCFYFIFIVFMCCCDINFPPGINKVNKKNKKNLIGSKVVAGMGQFWIAVQ